jgi:hypothetical protein
MPSGVKAEWRVAIGDEQEGVGPDTVVPADHALDEVKQRAWVTAGEENREPGHDGGEERGDRKSDEQDVVGDRQ